MTSIVNQVNYNEILNGGNIKQNMKKEDFIFMKMGNLNCIIQKV